MPAHPSDLDSHLASVSLAPAVPTQAGLWSGRQISNRNSIDADDVDVLVAAVGDGDGDDAGAGDGASGSDHRTRSSDIEPDPEYADPELEILERIFYEAFGYEL